MVILDDDYFIASDDWLRVRRRILGAKWGVKIPIEDRLYIDVDDVGILPEWIPLYKDFENRIFVVKSDAEKWDEFQKFKKVFKVIDNE